MVSMRRRRPARLVIVATVLKAPRRWRQKWRPARGDRRALILKHLAITRRPSSRIENAYAAFVLLLKPSVPAGEICR